MSTATMPTQVIIDLEPLMTLVAEGFASVNKRLDSVENRLDKLENRLDSVENRLDSIENRLGRIETDVASLKDGQDEIFEKFFGR